MNEDSPALKHLNELRISTDTQETDLSDFQTRVSLDDIEIHLTDDLTELMAQVNELLTDDAKWKAYLSQKGTVGV